jgi:hypothetical protein
MPCVDASTSAGPRHFQVIDLPDNYLPTGFATANWDRQVCLLIEAMYNYAWEEWRQSLQVVVFVPAQRWMAAASIALTAFLKSVFGNRWLMFKHSLLSLFQSTKSYFQTLIANHSFFFCDLLNNDLQ